MKNPRGAGAKPRYGKPKLRKTLTLSEEAVAIGKKAVEAGEFPSLSELIETKLRELSNFRELSNHS